MVESKKFVYVSSPLQSVHEKILKESNAHAIDTAYSIIKHLAVEGVEKVKEMDCIAVSGVLSIDIAMNIYNPTWSDEKLADAKQIRRNLIFSSDFIYVVRWNGEPDSKEVLDDIAYAKKLGKEIVYEGRE